MLETTIQQSINRLELCEKNTRNNCQIVTSLKDAAYEWVINFSKLKECKQYSGLFYVVLLPFSFELSAVCVNNRLEVWLHRYRGKTERQVGTIVCSLQNFVFVIYVIGRDGRMKSRRMHCETMKLNVNGGCDRSLANGWPDFLLARDWRQWLTNNNLHIFCRVELALL